MSFIFYKVIILASVCLTVMKLRGYNINMLNSIPSGFNLFGLEIRFYGIIMAVAMAIGVFLACKNAKLRGLTSENILILALYTLPLAVIGARMFSFFSERELYSSFWQIFNLRTGGMSIYGGIIGGAVAILLYSLIHKKNFFALADVAVPSLILGQAIGRWGNFFNQEVYGFEVTNPSFQWFPFSVYIDATNSWHLALFFYEFLLNVLIFLVLMFMLRKTRIKKNGIIMATYLIAYGAIRACLEPLRIPKYILYVGSLRLSLLVSIIAIACGVAYFVYYLITKLHKNKAIIKQNENSEDQSKNENKKQKDDNK